MRIVSPSQEVESPWNVGLPFISQTDDSARLDSTVSPERAGGASSERLSFAQGARKDPQFPCGEENIRHRFWTDKCLEFSISKLSKEIFNLK
jgi:hypothetical protein